MVKARMPHGENSSKQTERIDAILERSQAVDELVRLVVEGALVESPFESRYPFGKKGVKWVTSDQVGRRMERMGLERLPEVFAVLAPGLEGHLARTWKWMTSRPHRFRYGFDRPNDEGLNTYYEVWWLRELAKDLTRVEPLAPLELAKVAGFDEVGNHTTDAAADYLASVIAEGGTDGEAILKSLTDAVEGQISGAGITGLVTNALIRSPRREGWAALQHALVHAGAEENVCRTIASNVFEGDDEPGLALTKVIASNGLLKRPSVLEEMNGWVGMLWKPKEVEKCQKVLEKLLHCLEHPVEREAHLKSEDAELMYLGLWCVGREDAAAAVEKAATILREDPSTERRMACLWFLSRMEDDTVASAAIGRAVGDSEVRIACIAIEFLSQGGHSGVDDEQLYKDCDALAPKLGKMPKKVPSLLWPWCIAKPSMASLKRVRPPKPTARVEPEPDEPVVESPGLRDLDTLTIEKFREEAAAEPPDGRLAFWRATLEAVARRYQARVESQHQAILDGTHDSDRNPFPKELQSLQNDIIDEVSVTFPAEMVRMAAEFMASGEKALNECGMIALNRNAKAGRMVGACQRVAREYVRRKQVTTEYGIPYWLKDVLAAPPEDDELWEVLGQVVRREELTTPAPLQLLPAISTQPTGRRIVEALNAWIWENREMMVPNGRDSQGTLLEGYMLRPDWKLQRDEDLARMPLTAELGKWWDARSQDMRDDDGCELARAELLRGDGMASRYLDHSFKDEAKLNSLKPLLGEIHGTEQPLDLHQDWPLDACLAWLRRMHPRSEGESRLMLDAMEKWQLAHERMEFTCPPRMGAWNVLRADGKHFETLTREQGVRLFHALLRFLPKGFVYPGDLVKAHEAGYATDSDLAYAILGGLDPQNRQGLRTVHSILNGHIKQPPTVKVLQKCAAVVTRDQISHAGTIPTPYTKAALDTNGVWGADIAIDLVRALGEAGPERAAHHNNTNPQSVLSHLLKQSRPDASDTPESFRAAAAQADVTKAQLVAMAVFNPRWVSFVEHAMKMSGLAEAVWWLLSHTSGHPLFESAPANQEPKAQITQRTAISLDDLKDGAADVAWFQRVYAALGSDGWAQVTAAAKHASAASGHMRPLLYAAAILGEISLDESEQRILTKRHQDSVRALGIIPLPEEAAAKRIEMRRRYEVLREFRRGTHKFGAERKLNEERAAALSMESLARNAGYDDPIRMEWDLEEDAVREIFERVEKLNKGDLKCELVIEPSGKVTLSVMRAGKELKAPPPELRKDPAFTALKADREGLQARATRARAALEDFMVRGVTFPVTELAMLMRHPLLAQLLGPLVLKCGDISGRASSDGILLTDVMGKGHRLPESGVWKIAHPHDLLPAATWALWQLHCVEQKVVQPFKQVFREFYAVTKGEESSPGSSVRYQGSVVKPPQALALLGQRGWLHSADEGVRKFFREAGIEAGFSFDEYFHVPSEVDSATVREVSFHRMETGGKVLPLSKVPPVLFSEVMRDLDLMVSVAWTGSGEPQFTPSTLEMRAALVNAITTAMKISNIEAEGRYAKIAGKFGEYRVHLGSAVVRKSDSTMIWLEPVKQDTKTPLFLPFADPDPGSAEVVAKVLLLAADDRIKDAALIKKLRDA